jgi:hypothetical protein
MSGEMILSRQTLVEAAFGDLLPPAARSVLVPNAFGEGGSPADA